MRENMETVKNEKALGPGDIPVDVRTCVGESALEFLTKGVRPGRYTSRCPEMCRRECTGVPYERR